MNALLRLQLQIIFFRFFSVFVKTKRTLASSWPLSHTAHTHTNQHKCRAELMNYAHHCGPRARARQLRFRRTDSPKLKETKRETKKKLKRTTHDSHIRIGIVTTANTHGARAFVSVFKCAVFNCVAASLISFIYNNSNKKSKFHPKLEKGPKKSNAKAKSQYHWTQFNSAHENDKQWAPIPRKGISPNSITTFARASKPSKRENSYIYCVRLVDSVEPQPRRIPKKATTFRRILKFNMDSKQ